MKKLILLTLLMFLCGCASVDVPKYIKDDHPYKKTVYADFDEVFQATVKILKEFGWEVSGTSDPSVFERTASGGDPQQKQILIFSKVRQMSLVLGSRYARINVYIRGKADSETEIEFRYVNVSSVFVKDFYNYRKDHLVDRMLQHIESLVKG